MGTFVFGLIQGFGFAGVLGELQLPPARFGRTLVQYKPGLEPGQLAMVLAGVPLLFVLRRRTSCGRWYCVVDRPWRC